MVIRKALALLIFLLTLPALGGAQVQLSIAPERGTTDDLFLFTVYVPGSLRAAYPVLVGGNDFSVTLLGPEESESGDGLIYRYNLLPRTSGTLTSPVVEIEIEGKKQRIGPLTVTVERSKAPVRGEIPQLMLKQPIVAKEIFLGEQLSAPVEIWTAVQIFDPHLPYEVPAGFVAESSASETRERRILDGREYAVIRYPRALYPTRTGQLVLPAARLNAKIQTLRSSQSPFFGAMIRTYALEEVSVLSSEVSIKVLPLPAGASTPRAPALVGRSSIELFGRFTQGTVGVAQSLRIELTSEGNLRPLPSKILPEISGARSYSESDQVSLTFRRERVLQKRTYQVTVVPTRAGSLTIPDLTVEWFDPHRKVWMTERTGGFEAMIAPNPKMAEAPPLPDRTDVVAAPPQPAPSTAPLPFEPPSVFERFNESVGVWNGIFIASLVSGLFLAGIVPYLFLVRQRAGAGQLKSISRAKSISELQRAFQEWLGCKSAAPDALRYAIQEQKFAAGEQLLLLEFVDELFVRSEQSVEALEAFRNRLHSLLAKLPSRAESFSPQRAQRNTEVRN